MSKSRLRQYRIDTSGELQNGDIILVDSDDQSAIDSWQHGKPNSAGKPCIYIGNNNVKTAQYSLRRTQLSGQLLKLLDKITIRELADELKTPIEATENNLSPPPGHIDRSSDENSLLARELPDEPKTSIEDAKNKFFATPVHVDRSGDENSSLFKELADEEAQTPSEVTETKSSTPPAHLEPSGDENSSLGRVLMIDDSLLVRKNMELCMQALNITLDTAEDAETGMRMIENKQYQMIFMDIVLPEMDGYQACKLIKTKEATRNVPVIMMTSKTSPFNKVRGVMVGCDQYLTKPVNARALRDVIAKYIPLEQVRQHA
ncbi:PleD family two-component system response regulator [Pseudomonadota bacterium]